MRKKIEFDAERALEDLVPSYAVNKAELDSYEKICESENAQIKSQMLDKGITAYSAGGYTAKYITSERTSMNEDKLLAIIKKHNIAVAIKTREYVDMDALENYLYHLDEEDEITKNILKDIDTCRDVKEVVTLRISIDKGEK